MFASRPDLDEVYPLAMAAKSRGDRLMYIEMEPRRRFDRYLNFWDGVLGRVIRRRQSETEGTTSIVVELNVADVLCAKRRAVERGEDLLARPLRANQFGPTSMPSTQR